MGYPPQGFMGTAASIHSGTAFPPSPRIGDPFYRTDLHELFIYNGTEWVPWDVNEASYIIFTDGTTIWAKNGTTGDLEFSGTDAATVIQSAINALTDGGKIFFREGTYLIDSSINLLSNIKYEGIRGASILQGNTVSSGSMLGAGDKENITIEGLTLDSASYFYATLTLSGNTKNVVIQDCEIENGYDRNLWMWDGGIAGKYVTNVIVKSSMIGKRAPVDGRPAITSGDPSVDINQVRNIILEGNILEGDLSPPGGYSYPFILLWTGGDTFDCRRVTIANNIFDSHHSTHVKVVGTQDTKIIGNTFFGGGGAIYITDQSSYSVIVANNTSRNNFEFIRIAGPDVTFNATIKNNIIEATKQDAISCGGCSGKVIIEGNVMLGCNTDNKAWYEGGGIMTISADQAGYYEIRNNIVYDLNTGGVPVLISAGLVTPAAEAIFEGNVFNRTNPFWGGYHPTLPNTSNAELYVIAKDFLAEYKMGRNYGFTDAAPEKVLLKTGYEDSGTATIASGTASIVVAHGLVATPTTVRVTGTHTEVDRLYVTAVGAANFTINAGAGNVTADRDVYWNAEV